MHAYERTQIESLIAEKDRGNPTHARAAEYLCQPDVAERLADWISPAATRMACANNVSATVHGEQLVGVECHQEMLLSRSGYGNTRIGYLDAVIHVRKSVTMTLTYSSIASGDVALAGAVSGPLTVIIRRDVERQIAEARRRCGCAMDSSCPRRCGTSVARYSGAITTAVPKTVSIGVEVKVEPAEISGVLRQINLYRKYEESVSPNGLVWVLATVYAPSALELSMLRRADIRHVRLGDAFHTWSKAPKVPAPDATYTTEI